MNLPQHQAEKIEFTTAKLPINFTVLGYLFIGLGIYSLIKHLWEAVFLLLIGLIIVLFKSGLVIDFNARKYKKYNGLFFIKIGEWMSISKDAFLKLEKKRMVHANSVLTISRKELQIDYRLYLYNDSSKVLLISGNKNEVFERANTIAKRLGIELKK
ncbi:MAG: hypothetical protein JXR60_00475 [Bacteroidales bacterium]|nr:hypothetical protein [Bacteroidales bacterium]